MRKILIVFGHPLKDSFCAALKNSYCDGARESGAVIKEIYVADLVFDPVLRDAYRSIQSLESDLLDAQEKIEWAEHIVFVYPVWWGGMPARLKGFIDRVFHPSWAFSFAPEAFLPNKLLKGRSGGLILTLDNFPVVFRWVYGMPAVRQMKKMILNFCGITPVWVRLFGSIKLSSAGKREKWLALAKKRGAKDAR